jgi:hypothetical protein
MKSVFDASTREELAKRINSVNGQSAALWGKMNATQMIMHCTLCDDMFLGTIKIKRVLIGRLIGKTILKKVLKDSGPFGKNSPTSPILMTDNKDGNIEQQKQAWINRIAKYENYELSDFVHPFFGPMTREQVGLLAYKHADHHLRQFGA